MCQFRMAKRKIAQQKQTETNTVWKTYQKPNKWSPEHVLVEMNGDEKKSAAKYHLNI